MLTEVTLTTVFVLAAAMTLLSPTLRFMSEHKIIATNYRGESIPTASGGFMLLLLIFVYISQKAANWGSLRITADFVLAACCVGFAGFLDDLIGDKKTKGIANHWRAWRERGVTSTAIVKAGATGAAGLILFSGDGPSWLLLLHLLLLLLATNAANLMDVRPGRTLKFYYVMLTLLALIAGGWSGSGTNMKVAYVCILPIFAGAGVLTYSDLKGKTMLGDTGANLLGFCIGCGFIWCAPVAAQVLLLLSLIALHALTWRRSLTVMIERHRWLRFIDGLGRERIE